MPLADSCRRPNLSPEPSSQCAPLAVRAGAGVLEGVCRLVEGVDGVVEDFDDVMKGVDGVVDGVVEGIGGVVDDYGYISWLCDNVSCRASQSVTVLRMTDLIIWN